MATDPDPSLARDRAAAPSVGAALDHDPDHHDPDRARHREHLERLTARLPGPVRRAVAWLLRPGAWWLRIPLGLLCIVGGFLGFLPLLGFWMLPLGALLLAEDIPFIRRPTTRALDAVHRWWTRRRR